MAIIFHLKKTIRNVYNFFHPVVGEIWQLHRVRFDLSADENIRKYEITPDRLEQLIVDYKKRNFTFISLNDMYERFNGNFHLNNKYISITLDDGYEDNYLVAYPIFKKYNIPFTIFISKSYITGFKMLSTEQILALSKDNLCTIGGHTVNHPHLTDLSYQLQEHEICECNKWLKNITGKPILFVAFPYGDYNNYTIDIIKKNNIKCSFAAWGGGVRLFGNVCKVPRVLVTENNIE